MPQWIFWEDNISFYVVFGAAVYRPSSRVDYTERRKTERKKEKCIPITSPAAHHREKKYCVRNKNETVLKYATMKFFHKFCSFWSFGVYRPSSSMVDYTEREERLRERKGKCFPHYITGPPQREEVLRERKIKLNF